MFLHNHPYSPFIPEHATRLIVGTLPPPRFTSGSLKDGDVDFCYGSRDGQLWPILNRIFDLNLPFETTEEAIRLRKEFLVAKKLGICDIVESAKRDRVDASDLGMKQVQLRDMIAILTAYKEVNTLLFMGGNSKNGPEYFFRKLIKNTESELTMLSADTPRIHEFRLPQTKRVIRTVSLIAPSGAANRAVGSLAEYKRRKLENPSFTTIDYRVEQYRKFFQG